LDVPLARATVGGGDAAFRRVIDLLVREELIFVSQLLKSSWNRSNFLRLNYHTFAARFIEGDVAAIRADETANSMSLRSAISNSAESTKHKGEKLEEKKRESDEDHALSSILDPFISRKNGDDPGRDRRRLREIEKLVHDGDLTIDDVRRIASDPEVCFASELVERGKTCAKERRQHASDLARVASEAAENAHQTEVSNRQKQRVDTMRAAVECLPPSDLNAFCDFVATRLGSTALRERVLTAIRTRKLELPHIAAAALEPFEAWQQSVTLVATHA
jgi:polyhydroxyalkanoate synthesis regulator phasin